MWARMFALIATAGAVSWSLDPGTGRIALASLVAFSASAVASAILFQIARRYPVLLRANSANAIGACVDSLVFPAIAFGAIYPGIAAMQFLAKVAGGALWSLLIFRKASTEAFALYGR